MKTTFKALTIIILGFLVACNTKTSEKPHVANTLTTRAEGLAVDTVFVSTEAVQPGENTFFYGQTFYTNFKDISGFKIVNGDYFPELEVVVVSKAGTVLLENKNLFGGLGQPQDVSTLHGLLILANPIFSGDTYTARYKLYDTKGDAAYFSEMDFKVIQDPHIEIEENGLKVREVYLFNKFKDMVFTDGIVGFDESISLDFQLLEGYKIKNNKIELGMEIHVTDAAGVEITKSKDALENHSYDVIRDEDVIQSTLILTKGRLKNPITWQVRLWDKNSDAELTATATITAK